MQVTPPISFIDAAAYLGLSPHGLRKLIDRSRRALKGPVKGATIRFAQDGKGGTIRFRPEWLEEYFDRITVAREEPVRKLDWADLN